MRAFHLIISLLISPCIFSQAIFDSTKVRSHILRTFDKFPQTNMDTLIAFNSILPSNSQKLEKKIKDLELIELTNHSKASVRIYALQTLIWRNQKYAWQLLQKNMTDTVDWLLLPIEDGVTAKTFIDELLENIVTGPSNNDITESQRAYIATLKTERRQSRRNFNIQQYLKNYKKTATNMTLQESLTTP